MRQARRAIEQFEAQSPPLTQALDSVNALTARLLAVQASGSLADRVREVVQANQMRAN